MRFDVGSRSRSAKRFVAIRIAAPVVVVAVAVLAAVGTTWKPSRSESHRSGAVPARRPRTVAFTERLPVLKAILETPPTAGVANAVEKKRDAPARTAVPLHRGIVGDRPLRILVVGDSVGETFGRGMDLWARAQGNVQVLNEARRWCPLGRGLPIVQGLSMNPVSDGCAGWGSRWSDAIRSFDPDVVFVLFTIWEVAPRQLPESGEWLRPGDRRLDTWQLSEYQAAADVLSARRASVVWFTIPCEDGPIPRGSPLWWVNRRTIPELDASRRAVHVVDLDHELCRNGPTEDYRGVRNFRPVGEHFSDAGALAVANWVMPIVLGNAPNPPAIAERDVDLHAELPAPATRRAS